MQHPIIAAAAPACIQTVVVQSMRPFTKQHSKNRKNPVQDNRRPRQRARRSPRHQKDPFDRQKIPRHFEHPLGRRSTHHKHQHQQHKKKHAKALLDSPLETKKSSRGNSSGQANATHAHKSWNARAREHNTEKVDRSFSSPASSSSPSVKRNRPTVR